MNMLIIIAYVHVCLCHDSCDILARVVSRIYFSNKHGPIDASDVLGHLGTTDHILMVLKAMMLSTEYCSDTVMEIARSILKELYDRYGDDGYLDGLQEINRLLQCTRTVMNIVSSSTNQQHPDLADRISHGLIYCADDNECRANLSECWRQCIEHGCIHEACMLVNVHMDSTLMASDFSTLKLKQLASSFTLQQVIQFVNESLKPTLLRLQRSHSSSGDDIDAIKSESSFFKNIVLGLCVDLCSRATIAAETSENNGSPFDPNTTTAVKIAVDVLKVVVDSDVSENSPWQVQLTKAKALLHGLQLQRYLWITCDSPMSLKDIMDRGLPGIISHRLLNVTSEETLAQDIRERVQPLCLKFEFSLEEYLEQMLREVVNTYLVVSTQADMKDATVVDMEGEKEYMYDADDDFFNGEKNDKSRELDKVTTLSRLVIFLDFIIKPSLRASATLLLFQIPATGDALAACSSGDNKKEKDVAQLLLRIAEECIQSAFVDLSTVDVLKEVMRSHRLRMLAGKYSIYNIDIRDHAHIRAAVGTIAAQCSSTACTVGEDDGIHNPISDTVEFGTMNADPASVYSRALVHCATTFSVDTSVQDIGENNPQIASLLQSVPQFRLVHVIEDACTSLFQSMHQRYSCSGFVIEDEFDKAELIASCRGCIQIISYFIDKHRGIAGEAYSIASLSWLNQDVLIMLKKLLILQIDLKMYVSPRVMMDSSMCKDVVKKLCTIKVTECIQQNGSLTKESTMNMYYPFTPASRRVCSLLGVSSIYMGHCFLQELLKANQNTHAIHVARSLGAESNSSTCTMVSATSTAEDSSSSCAATSEDAELLLDASITLVRLISEHQLRSPVGVLAKAARTVDMNGMDSFTVSKDMLGNLAGTTPSSHLEKCVDLLICNDLIVSVQGRIQSASASPSSSSHEMDGDLVSQFSFSNSTKYSKDGILMTSGSIQGPVLKLAYQEIQRRWKKGNKSTQKQNEIPQVRMFVCTYDYFYEYNLHSSHTYVCTHLIQDIKELVEILQRNENHMLASRVMMTSWYSDESIGKSLNSSLLSLGRKVLGYRDIDSSLAVACYSTLTPNTMVRELQAVVSAPSTQVDFSRLHILSGNTISQHNNIHTYMHEFV